MPLILNAARKATGDYRQFKDVKFHGDEITYVSLGEGTTSEGEFWEALNTASNSRLPLIFVVEDNGYAISVPVEVQTAGGNISRLVSGFPNFHFEEVDGTDPVASYAAFVRSVAHCRAGHGPAFVHAHVIRPYSHSLSDDERLYRPDVERQRDAQRDPITRMQMFLIREGILDEKGINRLEKQVDDDLQVAVDRALQAPAADARHGTAIRVFAEPGSHVVCLRNPAGGVQTRGRGCRRQEGCAQNHGRSDHRHACATRCAATNAL